MSMNNNIPTYSGVFGDIDFKEGDESRSVYSPAAYLADLLQMMDDEFDMSAVVDEEAEIPEYKFDFDSRRADIKNIELDAENTTTLIPYLDIVNEVLEGRVNSDKDTVYETLEEAAYPFNMPFSLDNEKVKNHIKHLGISAHELRRLFATDVDYPTVAREYLGLSVADANALVDLTTTGSDYNNAVISAYGADYDTTLTAEADITVALAAFVSSQSNLSNFLDTTDLEAKDVRELIYQNLFIEPSDHSIVEDGREMFYINQGLSSEGYVTLNTAETAFEWYNLTGEATETVPFAWFDRANRFIRLAQKTGLSFVELDLILRNCCNDSGVPEITESSLIYVAQVAYFKKMFDTPVENIVAILSEISYTGRTNKDLPQDFFNKVFNLPCVSVDKKYFHIDGITGDLPDQFEDTTYDDYEKITYSEDLFSDNNDYYRKRIRNTLGFSETDLINIMDRLEFEEVAESSLWEDTENEWDLLNILYRIHAVAKVLDVNFLELFTLFDLLEQDPYLGRMDPNTYFIYQAPSTQKCFEILCTTDFDTEALRETNVADRLWLMESLVALTKWMKELGYSADMLWKIVNGAPKTDKEMKEQTKQDIEFYNGLLTSFDSQKLTPDAFNESLGDERAAKFAYQLAKKHCGHSAYHQQKLMKYEPIEMQKLAHKFVADLGVIDKYDFVGLSLETKLLSKIESNLIAQEIIDGKGKITVEEMPAFEEFDLETDFGPISKKVYELFHNAYNQSLETSEDAEDIDAKVFKSDLMDLGLEDELVRELYDNLIYKAYIDADGNIQNPDEFSDMYGSMELNTGITDIEDAVYDHLDMQFAKFQASRVMISASMFDELELKHVELQELMTNLEMSRYIDENGYLVDKMRIVNETPASLEIGLDFYTHRQKIYDILNNVIMADKDTFLKIDREYLGKIADKYISEEVATFLVLQYFSIGAIEGNPLAFFTDDENKDKLVIGSYFDKAKTDVIFDQVKSIVEYAKKYQLKDEALTKIGFTEEELAGLKDVLKENKFIDAQGVILPDAMEYFTAPENSAHFVLPGYEDYDREIFFALFEAAKEIKDVVESISNTLKGQARKQENAVLEQVQSALGIEEGAVKIITQHIFKAEKHLHAAWLMPLLEEVNALGQLAKLPTNMHYTQSVKRARQLGMLISKLMLNDDEINILMNDQKIIDKFPEDIILPDDVTHVDAMLETEEFIYLFSGDYYWIYLAKDYTMIDKKEIDIEVEDDADLIDLQKKDEAQQKRLKEDPIRQLFDEEDLTQVDAAFIDAYGTWCVISGIYHYVRYEDSDSWDRRDNNFGQMDNDFENLEMIDSAYVNAEGHLYLFANDKFVRYTNPSFTLDPDLQTSDTVVTVDQGYPKSIAHDWNKENQPVQLPTEFSRDLGPMFDGIDDNSYAFYGARYISSEDGEVREVAEMWGHREYNFGETDSIDAAMASAGSYFLFRDDKVVKYSGSIEHKAIQPEEGYPKAIHQAFTSLPGEFSQGVDAALHGEDGTVYLFHDDEYVTASYDAATDTYSVIEQAETRAKWGIVANDIATSGTVDAAFVGLDGYTYIFSGTEYVRYSGNDYSEVDEGFPRNIEEDWEGLVQVTGAFVLGSKTYLFGSMEVEVEEPEIGTVTELQQVYVRYSTLRKKEDDLLEYDEEDPNERTIETVLAYRPDVDDIEVFPAEVDAEFWSLPKSLTEGVDDFQVDAVMNGPDGKVFLFYGDSYIEHDHNNRWWSEPKVIAEQWDRIPSELVATTGDPTRSTIQAGLMGKDGFTYLFYNSMYLRFSDKELRTIDNGFPRSTKMMWGKVRNNIERTGMVDATLVVESRWEEQDDDGRLVDVDPVMHTYLFSGDQFYRYEEDNYDTVEPGYPRPLSRLKEEPRFKDIEVEFPEGFDAAFADQRQVFIFVDDAMHAVIGDEDNYREYGDATDTSSSNIFANIQAITEQEGITYTLNSSGVWNKLNHVEDRTQTQTAATPRIAEKTPDTLSADISAVLHGTDGHSYVFSGTQFYDAQLEHSFTIEDVWGRSRNPIFDQETIDAAFVGRDGVTYVFSGEWFVQYDSTTYEDQMVQYPPRRISDKWRGLENVALAYVWKEETVLFERPNQHGEFRYLRYSKDSYETPDSGYPRLASQEYWNIPASHLAEGFDNIDSIFVHEDNLVFIADQKFISLNLDTRTWSFPQPLELLYEGIPFNKTDFKDLKSGFVGADGTAYFFNQQCFVSYDSTRDPGLEWSDVQEIKDHWGLQENIFANGVDAAYVGLNGATYLFAGDKYVKYSTEDYRYVDENYPKEIATYLRDEPDFEFLTKEFQQHLDELEEAGTTPMFNGIVDNGRCIYFFTNNTVFAGSTDKYAEYDIDGLGNATNNFLDGWGVNAAFVDTDTGRTFLFSGEQYIRYSNSYDYRYIDDGYPKVIAESLADEGLNFSEVSEDYRDGIDAAFYLPDTGAVLFNEKGYVFSDGTDVIEGEIANVWGILDNAFLNATDASIDGAVIDNKGRLLVFKDEQFVRYSDTEALFELNPYDEPRYVDSEYPQDIRDVWPQLDTSILPADGSIDSVFRFEDEIYFHTDGLFSVYDVSGKDMDQEVPVQVLAYRWGEWSDYLLTDVHAISRFKDLGERYTSGDITLTELVSGSMGAGSLGGSHEPYMQFAKTFGFEKEEVRWVKQRNAFLQDQSNIIEEDFQLELVLRMFDILSTTQRLNVDVSPLYFDVWSNLYNYLDGYDVENLTDEQIETIRKAAAKAAAKGAYDVLVAVDCNNNFETLVKQIDDELNTLKRDALVPYVIDIEDDVDTTRGLYQKLLIDIEMSSCAETSRIKEAIAAVQLYLHRYFINLEDLELVASDQEEARSDLKERWEWMQNYRVWEANRKVFLYPENYIRPELRDIDSKSTGFKALEESLNQGELTEDTIEEAYFKYLDAFTEVSELTIAGGYAYDDNDDKKLLVIGRTRTDPMRYFYRFGTFVNGDSSSATWDPWTELDIPIEATRVEPVYAFNRVFIFWTTIEETTEDTSSATVSVSGDDPQTVSSGGNTTSEVKIYYSFYNLNKRWTQPQAMQTEFNGSSELKSTNGNFDDVELFVENTTKLEGHTEAYENIYVALRSYAGDIGGIGIYGYAAYNLTPELYSVETTAEAVENRGQELFEELFPAEGSIEEDNVVMFNYSANSVDGPWFAYNHNGAGFMVKPSNLSASSDDSLTSIPSDHAVLPVKTDISAAVQLASDGDTYFFYDDGTWGKRDAAGVYTDEGDISEDWGKIQPTAMEDTGIVDSAYVIGENAYLTLNEEVYQYDYSDEDSEELSLANPARLVKTPSDLTTLGFGNLADLNWSGVGASFSTGVMTYLFEKGGTGVLRRNELTNEISDELQLADLFGNYQPTQAPISSAEAVVIFNDQLHVISGDTYTAYSEDGSSASVTDITVDTVAKTIFDLETITGIEGASYSVAAIIAVEGGLWIRGVDPSDSSQMSYNFFNSVGTRTGEYPSNDVFADFNDSSEGGNGNWLGGTVFTQGTTEYQMTFYGANNGSATVLYKAFDTSSNNGNGNGNGNNNNVDFQSVTNSSAELKTAFVTAEGDVILVAADDTYRQINANTPQNIINSFSGDRTDLAELELGTFLDSSSSVVSLIGNSATGIDAAYVGNGIIGASGSLYLFIGEYYYRFDQIGLSGIFNSTADETYPIRIEDNEEGFPQVERIDAAFTSPASAGSNTYFFYNGDGTPDSEPVYYYTTSFFNVPTLNGPVNTAGVWGVEIVTKLLNRSSVDAAYVADGVLYLLTGSEYIKYTLDASNQPGEYIDDDTPYSLPDSVVDVKAGLLETLGDTALSFDNIKSEFSSLQRWYTALSSGESDSDPINVDAAFVLAGYIYLFSGNEYYRVAVEDESRADGIDALSELTVPSTITGSWGNMPSVIRAEGLDAAFTYTTSTTENNVTTYYTTLYFIKDGAYISYDMWRTDQAQPYEVKSAKYEVIRLTSSTAEKLNQILFADGVDGLLKMSTQEINESPTISFDETSPDNIQMNEDRFDTEPTNSHLDFNSANGLYYWEVYFHTPFLIAQALNADQKFEDAKTWLEYIYDPTEPSDYWKFLPFLAADPDALMASLSNDITNYKSLIDFDTIEASGDTDLQTAAATVTTAETRIAEMTLALQDYQDVFLGTRSLAEVESTTANTLSDIANWDAFTNLAEAIDAMDTTLADSDSDDALLVTWKNEMQEVVEIIEKLPVRISLMDNYTSQLTQYLEDPFDPHAIAGLRSIAYRKTIVMRYVDNLLDWGDLLFRQYTRESINEARMLYILAYDILGEKPQTMGQVILSNTATYNDLAHYVSAEEEDYDFLFDYENTVLIANNENPVYGDSLSFAAQVSDTVVQPYFFLKENELFTEYWDRVEDRLAKIRACQNIDGIAVPLPLFQPPIDPMALVNAAASGGGVAAAAAASTMAMVPEYRFSSQFAKAKEITGKLKGFSDALVGALEKKDGEELSMLQNKQESAMLEMTTLLKDEAILEAIDSLENLKETKRRAEGQETHYNNLISTGYLPEEITQMTMMGTAAVIHGVSALGKYVAGLSYIVPQFTAGPFSFGVTAGGENVGAMMGQFGEAIQSGAEALSMGGEIAGVAAQFKRTAEDWEMQRDMATSEIKQLDYQIKAQEHRLKMTKHELIMHEKDIENKKAINDFMTNKFSNAQLYSWTSGKISGLFFQTYKMAHDYAKQAEQAYVFEKGIKPGDVNFISGMYWDSQKKGMMSGETLELDLDKMEKSYRESNSRSMEITKNVSLLELDPLALMELKNKGACTFRLTEELFDYDFPGHYNRQIKTVSLKFDIGEGQSVNATLTQLSSHQVMEADIKAVKHLLDPANEATVNVRSNWRANQQVALSEVDQYTENNGMFELNFGDERYLPFEGTGAVSNWRLELKGKKGSYNPADLLDVTVKLRYSAQNGGSRFENEVKGLLKPFHETAFFDMAYNFPNEWDAIRYGDKDVEITFNRDMFPNMSSSKVIGLYIRYEYEEGQSGATFTINDDLSVPGDTYLQPGTLSVGTEGTTWKFTPKGDRTGLKNAEMVVVYKAKL